MLKIVMMQLNKAVQVKEPSDEDDDNDDGDDNPPDSPPPVQQLRRSGRDPVPSTTSICVDD